MKPQTATAAGHPQGTASKPQFPVGGQCEATRCAAVRCGCLAQSAPRSAAAGRTWAPQPGTGALRERRPCGQAGVYQN